MSKPDSHILVYNIQLCFVFSLPEQLFLKNSVQTRSSIPFFLIEADSIKLCYPLIMTKQIISMNPLVYNHIILPYK